MRAEDSCAGDEWGRAKPTSREHRSQRPIQSCDGLCTSIQCPLDEQGVYAEFDVGKLYVYGVSLLIGFIGYSSQIFVFWNYLGGFSPKTVAVLGIFNILLHLLFYNYYLAVSVPPGHVPIGWEPPRDGANVYELKRDTLKPRYCRICKGYKPPRTHHCSDCDRCVLKMDHHCPWTNNCVGFYNQPHFLRFVYTVDVTCAMALAIHTLRMYELVLDSMNGTYYVRQPTQTEVAFLIINMTLLFFVLLFVGILSGYHLYLVGGNTTTIEAREKERVAKLVQSRKCQPTPYPYNLGIVRNFKSVFGDSPLLWWVPKQLSGTGLDFAIRDGLKPPVYWPPPGYNREVGDPLKVKQGCDSSRTVFQNDGVKVISEIDDDGEMVIRQYNRTQDPAALECGGEVGNNKQNGGMLTGFFDSGRDDKSEGEDPGSFDESSDSDDDMENLPQQRQEHL
ncbi:zf-DHHC-domain-containing protein [Linderina pennispora]|uniref:Palmitoyltransferase n=1 Tax=Linderina pennispora TaxID=61395 RepID=A0A1Y1W0D1_9FUNG|nr:zf-DHHC-domain-containing protein [Linderina pennispora]ORX66953.1 zf-DHHC-domain-containing protein [Linderina pennispora]